MSMTLDEMVEHVTTTMKQTDADSLSDCAMYINRRYRTIADAWPWLDLQITTTSTANAHDNDIPIPGTMDRVISIGLSGGAALEPVDATFLLQTDPTLIFGEGVPKYYQEWTDPADDSRRIKLHPIPAVTTGFVIVGKRTVSDLSGTDTPLIRNIDNCLLTFALHDMLRRVRQWAKADEALKEASASLEAAKALETQQSNRPRVSKNLSVSGNTLIEMTDAVCARLGDWSLPTRILVRDTIRRNYQTVYDMHLWAESTVIASVESDGTQLVLPEYIDQIIQVRANASLGALTPTDLGVIFGIAPGLFEQTTGAQIAYTRLTPAAVAVLPPGLERLEIVSTSPADKGNVFIRGESEGKILSETLEMDGTSAVASAYSYDVPITISKGVTDGDFTITGYTSTVELQTLPATESERKHIRLWLQPGNTTGTTCLVYGKCGIKPLLADEDTPMLRNIQNTLIELTLADLTKDAAQEQRARAKATDALQTMIDLETRQGASQPRVIPTVEPEYYAGCYGGGDWLTK